MGELVASFPLPLLAGTQPNSPPKTITPMGQIWPPDRPAKLGSWTIEHPNWVYITLKLQVGRVIWSPDTSGDILAEVQT